MQENKVKIQDIEANFDHILTLVGSKSFVNWDHFTKTSSDLTKQMEELTRGLTIYRQIQQKRFINAMRTLKCVDVPDLIKTVKNKKLPKEALKTILSKFVFDQNGKIQLATPVETLQKDSEITFHQYTDTNEILTNKLKEATDLVALKIHQSGLYEEPQPPKEIVSTFKAKFSQSKLEQLKKQIKVDYQPGTNHISIQTYGQIVHNTFGLVKDEYKRLTLEARAKQRSLISNSQNYIEALIQYLNNTEALILEGQRLLAKTAGLQQKKVQQSEVYLMQRGLAQPILLIQSGLRTTIKQSIAPQHEVNFETTKKIVRNQVQLIKQKTPFFKEMFLGLERTPQNFQIIPLIIALTLNDFIYLTYKLEQEDFMKSVTDQIMMNNPEVSAIFKEMETAIIRLMREAEIINEDMAKVIEMQSQNIQNHAGDAYNQMYGQNQGQPGGILPGSNPLDLLRDSQKHQFDQMKGKKL